MNMAGLRQFIFFCILASSSCIEIATKYGKVRGQTLELNTGKRVNTFLGIPFAKSPAGSLRWKAPQEPEPWTTPFIANQYGNMCPQSGSLIEITHPDFDKYEEDCLNLNIYTPNNSAVAGPYPVIVYIHGGAYHSSGNIQYPGHFNAAEDVVVVVTNYRLGILGFMSTGDDAITSNVGLLDQKQSLIFVKENIAAFGGDPNKVTIIGQSAGGSSVGLHLVSPQSAGLFHQAVCMSGNDLAPWAIGGPESSPENMTFSVAEKLNCSRPTTTEMVECLRTIHADIITSTGPDAYPGAPFLGFSPVVDGPNGFLPDTPLKLREQGKYAKVPLVTGLTTEDGSLGVPAIAPDAILGGFNRTEYVENLRNLIDLIGFVADQNPYRTEQTYQAIHQEYTNWPHINDLEGNRQTFVRLATDLAFGFHTDAQAKHHSQENPTYMYLFGWRSTNASELIPEWMGVPHIGDVPYVWGYPLLLVNPAVREETKMEDIIAFNHEDLDYATYTIKLFTNFAKSSNLTPQPVPAPGNNQPTTWPRFDNTDLKHLLVRRQIQINDHYRQRTFALWTDYMPWIVNHKTTTNSLPYVDMLSSWTIKKTL